jgi:surface polysaccharide O-acyltransferase-like enzyme
MQERQANIELLRLISMFMLLFLHFYGNLFHSSEVYASQTGFWKNFPLAISSFILLLVGIYDGYASGIAWMIATAIFTIYFVCVLCFDHLRAYITNPIANGLDKQVVKLAKESTK